MIGLQIRRVYFSYLDGFVLNNVDLSIEPGEMVGLLGPNGSGKTTLIKLANGILRPTQGEVRLDATGLRQLSRKSIARCIAMVPQQFHISFAFTVKEVVALGRIPFMKAFAEESEADGRLVHDALELVGVSELAQRRFDELSGGERQKIVLAMALAQQPRLLLLDEPTAHLDICHQVEILEMVKALNKEQGLTVVAAIHDLNLASLYFNRLVLLKDGRVLADGSPSQVLTEPIIAEVFSASVRVEPHPVVGTPHIVVMPSGSDVEQQ
jgi:iron complex transport system ATP-binding protein